MDNDETDSIVAVASQLLSDTLKETSNIYKNLQIQISSNNSENLQPNNDDSDNDDLKLIWLSRALKRRKQKQLRSAGQKSTSTTTTNTIKPDASLNVGNKRNFSDDEEFSFVKFLRNCDDLTFQTHFKLTKTTFEALQRFMHPYVSNYLPQDNKNELTELIFILSSLWTLTTNESTRAIATRFNLKKTRCHRWFVLFCKIIYDNQKKFHIQWPGSKDQQYRSIEQFNHLGDDDGIIFPNICGIIGCTSLSSDQQSDVRLQCLCDANGFFLDCFISFTANYSNSMIFQQSKLFERLETDPAYPLPGSQLIADKSYPLRRYLYVPYKHLVLSIKEQIFNNNLIARKQIIDDAFSQLNKRFVKLKYLRLSLFRDQQQYIVAACALHNFCIQQNDSYELRVYRKCDDDQQIDIGQNEVTTDDDLTVEINRTNFLRLIK